MAVDDFGERAGQPGVWIDCVHLAGLDERGDNGPVFGSGVMMAREEGVLAAQGDGARDGVVVDLDAAVGQEASEAVAVFGDIGERLAQGRFGGGAGAMMGQPVFDTGEDLPPGRPSFITRVLGSDSRRFRGWQARRARSRQIAQAPDALLRGFGCPARNAARHC